ncbi:hypothetical protein VNI00_002301 [Paramarasmius palmivorus]|uniref:F-box domain-containing protein n=1 Tax=Paramarasmius palmivorus TaxID=297713 RepID=A0AAW0E2B4_9AGAR
MQAIDQKVAQISRDSNKTTLQTRLEEIRKLRSQRNSLTTISRLPPELLSRILAHCAFRSDTEISSLIRCTHVCSRWRTLALDTPSLWSEPEFEKSNMALEMLRRARNTPLHIKAALHRPLIAVREPLLEAIQNVSRIASLHIAASHNQLVGEIIPLLGKPAPKLQALYLETYGGTVVLPEQFLQDEAPRLRSLELFNVHIPWNSRLLSDLTTLSIAGNLDDTMLPSASHFMNVLRNMPALEVLALEESVPNISTAARESLPTLTLPNLRRLTLRSNILSCTTLVDKLIFPSTTFVYLVLRSTARSPEDAQAEFRLVKPSLQKVLAIPIIAVDYSHGCLTAWTRVPSTKPSERELGLRLEFAFLVKAQNVTSFDVAGNLVRAIPFPDLQTLRVSCNHEDVRTFEDCFGSCSKLKTVQFYGNCVYDLVPVLGKKMPNSKSTLFPALSTLEISEAGFDVGLDCPSDLRRKRLVGPLVKAIAFRIKCGMPSTKLMILACDRLFATDFEKIKAVAEVVLKDTPLKKEPKRSKRRRKRFDSDEEFDY